MKKIKIILDKEHVGSFKTFVATIKMLEFIV
jgi:hypothetical protein